MKTKNLTEMKVGERVILHDGDGDYVATYEGYSISEFRYSKKTPLTDAMFSEDEQLETMTYFAHPCEIEFDVLEELDEVDIMNGKAVLIDCE